MYIEIKKCASSSTINNILNVTGGTQRNLPHMIKSAGGVPGTLRDSREGYSMLVSRYATLKPLHERSFSSPNTRGGSVTYYTDSFQQQWIITGDGPLIIITTQVK